MWVEGRPIAKRVGSFARSAGSTNTRGGRWQRCRYYYRVEMRRCLFSPSSALLVVYVSCNGRWSTWTKQQATVALREVLALAGARAEEHALHSLSIGGAAHLSEGEASPEMLLREGEWASDAYKAYGRSHGKVAGWAANVVTPEGVGNGIQPGQGTDWRPVGPTPKLGE